MSMQRLMSAAHAAGYAMAAEDIDPEPRPEITAPFRESRAVAVRTPSPFMMDLLRLRRAIKMAGRAWFGDWVAAHWSGRATA